MNNISPNATRYTAIGLVVFGLLFIFFAWNGAAGLDNGVDIRTQFPFLISGGIGGLALVGAGLTLIRVFEGRRDTKEVVRHLERLTAAVERLAAQEEVPAHPSMNGLGTAPAMPPPAPPFEHAS